MKKILDKQVNNYKERIQKLLYILVMGLIFILPLAFSGLMAPDNPAFSKEGMLISTVFIGVIYGLLT